MANVVATAIRVEAALEPQEVHRPPERGPVDVKVPDGLVKVTAPFALFRVVVEDALLQGS